MVSTGYKRLFLRCVKIDAGARSIGVLTVLTELATAQVKNTAGGIFLTASQGNGQLYNVLPNAGEGLNPVSWAELIEEILTRWEDATAALINEDSIPAPNDEQIYAEVFSKLNAATEVAADFSGMSR
jgi:hypothetical protein